RVAGRADHDIARTVGPDDLDRLAAGEIDQREAAVKQLLGRTQAAGRDRVVGQRLRAGDKGAGLEAARQRAGGRGKHLDVEIAGDRLAGDVGPIGRQDDIDLVGGDGAGEEGEARTGDRCHYEPPKTTDIRTYARTPKRSGCREC